MLKISAVNENTFGMDFNYFYPTAVRKEILLVNFRAKEGRNYYVVYV